MHTILSPASAAPRPPRDDSAHRQFRTRVKVALWGMLALLSIATISALLHFWLAVGIFGVAFFLEFRVLFNRQSGADANHPNLQKK